MVIEHRNISKLSLFVTEKFFKTKTGVLTDVKRLRGGQLLVQADNQIYSEKLLGLSVLAGVLVKATSNWTLNSSKGVVRCAELKHASEDEIISELADQGVVDCFSVEVKARMGSDGKATLTFLPSVPCLNISRSVSFTVEHVD